jgi:hypothetical protein
MGTGAPGSARGGHDDSGRIDVLDTLRDMWTERDPVPPDLAGRVCFALELEDLEVELAQLSEELGLVGARGDEHARTVTFTSASLSVMVTLGEVVGGVVRVDGWIADGAGLVVTLRRGAGPGPATESHSSDRTTTADDDGRFVFEGVSCGIVQFVFRSPESDPDAAPPAVRLPRPVVTPGIAL